MPRKAKAATVDGEAPPMTGLSDTEMRFIKAVFDNMTQKPDANWDGVATDLGLKDAKCAKERFRQMSIRHGWRDQAGGNGTPRKGGAMGSSGDGRVGKRAPRTPSKKVVKSAALVTEEDDELVKGEPEEGVGVQEELEVHANGGEI
ncbi:hypothetical protein E4U42_003702 [Claviceps africana]|uniref:Myb-like domain-containing protein n=1 Tax=Claviceps africana TaxID=83212 RepID=A0A8K0J7G2_9HYPO|nr:hypothetical protein E4U42_003702 [Claviceps africana]